MKKSFLMLAIASFAIAAAIILFSHGLRVIYSGGFFIVLGIVLLLTGRQREKDKTD